MGYDIYRFVKGSVSDEFCCSICHDVLQEPQMIASCEHIFCASCIHEWIHRDGNCPVDRQSITLEQLRPPMRSFLNLIGQLQLSCDFVSFGCNELIQLSEIEDHQVNCSYNPGDSGEFECICGKRMLKSEMEKHGAKCVPYLKREIDRSKMALIAIKNENAKNEKVKKRAPRSNIFDVWHKENGNYEIIKSDMTQPMKDEALAMIVEGLNNRDENFLKVITEKMSQKYGNDWTSLISHSNGPFTYSVGTYLEIKIKKRHMIKLFESKPFPVAAAIREARKVTKPVIKQNTMTMMMADDAMTFAARAIFIGESELQIATLVQQRMAEKYKNNWNCIVMQTQVPSTFGLMYVPKQNVFIKLNFADLYVIIWQCP